MSNLTTEQQGGVNISGSTVFVAGNIVGRDYIQVTNNFFGDPSQARNRSDMLELVTNTWIKGVLEQSLYNQVWIELGLETQPKAVGHPWEMQLQMPDQPTEMLPPGTSMVQLFDQLNGSLLILGAPGAGKTTMLLQLARDLIARAEQDPLMRIPVVLNLSSWAEPMTTIAEWLVSALVTQYQVSKKIAQAWVEQDSLLLLLDGLDEVNSERREACVKAINTFRGEHGSTPLVVCSRIADYQALTERLNLRGAVLIQPLTPAQIEAYLERAGPELSAVRQTLGQDAVLQEMVQQPLMLSIMTLAYRGVPATDLTGGRFATPESHRRHLFDTYIDKMFHRVARTRNEEYTQVQSGHWLHWLAQKMLEQGASLFYLESLRRSWLPTPAQRRLAAILVGLVCGIIVGLVVALVAGLVGVLDAGLDAGLIYGLAGLAGGLTVGLAGGLVGGNEEPAELLRWRRREARSYLRSILVFGLGLALVGVVCGLGFVPILVSASVLFYTPVPLTGVPPTLDELRPTPVDELAPVLILILIFGLIFVVVGGLVGVLVGGLESGAVETRSMPNQGIRGSTKNAIATGVVIGLAVGLIAGLVIGLGAGLVNGLGARLGAGLGAGVNSGLLIGLIFGLIGGLFYGGYAAVNHYVVRLLLTRNNSMPLNYVRFLDYASERIFLRKVGGGYIFIHRMLMEHFAAIEDTSKTDL